jgi:hypothetical protein
LRKSHPDWREIYAKTLPNLSDDDKKAIEVKMLQLFDNNDWSDKFIFQGVQKNFEISINSTKYYVPVQEFMAKYNESISITIGFRIPDSYTNMAKDDDAIKEDILETIQTKFVALGQDDEDQPIPVYLEITHNECVGLLTIFQNTQWTFSSEPENSSDKEAFLYILLHLYEIWANRSEESYIFLSKNPRKMMNLYPYNDILFKTASNQTGGRRPEISVKPTSERFLIGKRNAIVYIGKRGCRYVRINKKLVSVKSLEK